MMGAEAKKGMKPSGQNPSPRTECVNWRLRGLVLIAEDTGGLPEKEGQYEREEKDAKDRREIRGYHRDHRYKFVRGMRVGPGVRT